MKGIINEGIQKFVETKFGQEAWDKIKEQAKCKHLFFSAVDDYPDQETVDLANAASKVLDLPLETVLVEFGKFWITNTAANSYPTYFKLAGKTAREFLLNMDAIHRYATNAIPNAKPPRFEYEETPGGRLLMHYHSERRLCPVLRGLIMGVGILFNEKLQLKEVNCMNNGAQHCTMEVSFQ